MVGSGHSYQAMPQARRRPPMSRQPPCRTFLDEFVRANKWHKRRRGIVRRKDRDGECFLRSFMAPDGLTLRAVRRAGPGGRPAAAKRRPRGGPGSADRPQRRRVGPRLLDRRAIGLRRRSAAPQGERDANVRRGLPLFFPVRKNLHRADKLLRNMSAVAEIQSAIALIRKHRKRRSARPVRRRAGRRRGGQSGHGPKRQLPPLRAGHDPRRDGGDGVRVSRRGPGRRALRGRAPGRVAGDRRAAGHARVHVHQRRQQRELRLDDGGRGAGGEDVRPLAARHDRGRPRIARAGDRARGGGGRLPAAVNDLVEMARSRRRWRCAIVCATRRRTRFSCDAGRCRRRRWRCATGWTRATSSRRRGRGRREGTLFVNQSDSEKIKEKMEKAALNSGKMLFFLQTYATQNGERRAGLDLGEKI